MQLTTALEGFWLSKARTVSQNTINDYSHTYDRFVRFLAGQAIEDMDAIKPQHIDAFLTWLATDEGLAPKTVLNHWIALSSLWTWAEKDRADPTSSAGASPSRACVASSPNLTPMKTLSA